MMLGLKDLVLQCSQGYRRRYKFTVLHKANNTVGMKISFVIFFFFLTGVLSRTFRFTSLQVVKASDSESYCLML